MNKRGGWLVFSYQFWCWLCGSLVSSVWRWAWKICTCCLGKANLGLFPFSNLVKTSLARWFNSEHAEVPIIVFHIHQTSMNKTYISHHVDDASSSPSLYIAYLENHCSHVFRNGRSVLSGSCVVCCPSFAGRCVGSEISALSTATGLCPMERGTWKPGRIDRKSLIQNWHVVEKIRFCPSCDDDIKEKSQTVNFRTHRLISQLLHPWKKHPTTSGGGFQHFLLSPRSLGKWCNLKQFD